MIVIDPARCIRPCYCFFSFFFFNDTATTEIYTLSLHDALPIFPDGGRCVAFGWHEQRSAGWKDRKSTRLNSSHANISYAVFCLKKKKTPENSFMVEKKENQEFSGKG